MTEASLSKDEGWRAVLERFEQHAQASVMTRTVLEAAFPPDWIDDVFETHHQYKYARAVVLHRGRADDVGRPRPASLDAPAASRSETLPVSLTTLYDKVNHTKPEVLRALV